MSSRDFLYDLICTSDGDRLLTDERCLGLADRIIAAGWQQGPTYDQAIQAARELVYKLDEAQGEMVIPETDVYLMLDRLWGLDPFTHGLAEND